MTPRPGRIARALARLRRWLRGCWLGRLPLFRALTGAPPRSADDERKPIRKEAPALGFLALERRETADQLFGVGTLPLVGAELALFAANPAALGGEAAPAGPG